MIFFHFILLQANVRSGKRKQFYGRPRATVSIATPLQWSKGAARGGAEGAQALPLAIRILMFIFLVIHQHCKSRSGVLQNVLRQYHKA